MLPISIELYRYWASLKARGEAPERVDVEPGAIRSILGETFMLDFDEDGGFPMRIAGSKAHALFMRELRGQPFLGLWRKEDRDAIRMSLRRSADDVRPVLLTGEAHPPGLETVRLEALALPLLHGGSSHSRMLGAIALEAAPQWLGLIGCGPVALTVAGEIDESQPKPAPSRFSFAATSAPAPAEAASRLRRYGARLGSRGLG